MFFENPEENVLPALDESKDKEIYYPVSPKSDCNQSEGRVFSKKEEYPTDYKVSDKRHSQTSHAYSSKKPMYTLPKILSPSRHNNSLFEKEHVHNTGTEIDIIREYYTNLLPRPIMTELVNTLDRHCQEPVDTTNLEIIQVICQFEHQDVQSTMNLLLSWLYFIRYNMSLGTHFWKDMLYIVQQSVQIASIMWDQHCQHIGSEVDGPSKPPILPWFQDYFTPVVECKKVFKHTDDSSHSISEEGEEKDEEEEEEEDSEDEDEDESSEES